MNIWPFVIFAILPATTWLSLKRLARIERRWIRNIALASGYFLFLASALLLLLSLPTGSIDISDLWRFLGFSLLPSLPLVALWACRSIQTTWLRIAMSSVSAIVLIPACGVFLLLCLAEVGCVRRSPPVYSPDGMHVALQEFSLAGALGDDYGSVYVRRSWWPFADTAYSGLGYRDLPRGGPSSPQIQWLDSSRLLIRYYDGRTAGDGRGGPAVCKSRAGGITILCENEATTDLKK